MRPAAGESFGLFGVLLSSPEEPELQSAVLGLFIVVREQHLILAGGPDNHWDAKP